MVQSCVAPPLIFSGSGLAFVGPLQFRLATDCSLGRVCLWPIVCWMVQRNLLPTRQELNLAEQNYSQIEREGLS